MVRYGQHVCTDTRTLTGVTFWYALRRGRELVGRWLLSHRSASSRTGTGVVDEVVHLSPPAVVATLVSRVPAVVRVLVVLVVAARRVDLRDVQKLEFL